MSLCKPLTFLAALFLLASSAVQAKYKPIQLEKSDKEIARYVARMMEVYHYSGAKMDNTMSERMFDEYFRYLDYNRRIFLSSDIEEFKVYEHLLDEMFKRGDLTFPLKIYKRYIERLESRVQFVKDRLKKPFDFTKEETYVVDRSEAEWPSSVEELDNIWRQHLKNEIIRFELSQIAEKEHAEKEAAANKDKPKEESAKKEGEEEKPKKAVTAQSTLIKRYNKFLKYQLENDRENFLEISLNVMTKCFDPHSNYFGSKAQKEFEISMKLSLTGIGATLMEDDGYTKVTSLVPGGPAHKGKQLKVGDRIAAVGQADDEPVDTVDMRLSKVVSMIRGEKGTIVTLHVLRGGVNGSKVIIKIKRDEIKLKESEAKGEIKEVKIDETKTKRVGVIHLPSFYVDWDALREGREGKSSTADIKKILESQIKEGIDSVIIDLRNNGGGSLPEAISLTGLFVDKGPVVQIRESSGRIMVRNDEDAGVVWDGPLVVLVNEGSASASEIFAAAIQDYKRGVIAGTYRTHGKGTVQQVQSLSRIGLFKDRTDIEPGQVKYTMAKFYRINGGSTQKKGVVPDIVFPSYAEHDDRGEATLRNVLKWDEIRNLNVDQNDVVKNIIPELKKRSEDRRQKSDDFAALTSDIDYFKGRLEIKSVSLNREIRIAEFQKDKEVREKREELMERLFAQHDEDEDEDSETKSAEKKHVIQDDVYLREALLIISDLGDLQKEQASK